jgi:hypothetical protein
MLNNQELAVLLNRAAAALQVPTECKPRDIDSIVADLLVEAMMRKSVESRP